MWVQTKGPLVATGVFVFGAGSMPEVQAGPMATLTSADAETAGENASPQPLNLLADPTCRCTSSFVVCFIAHEARRLRKDAWHKQLLKDGTCPQQQVLG